MYVDLDFMLCCRRCYAVRAGNWLITKVMLIVQVCQSSVVMSYSGRAGSLVAGGIVISSGWCPCIASCVTSGRKRNMQEGGQRAGTESILLVAGLGMAAALARAELDAASAHMAACRNRLQNALLAAFPPVCMADSMPFFVVKKTSSPVCTSNPGDVA